jgi:hypothetical protein
MKIVKVLCALFFSTSVFAASVVNLSIEPMKALEPKLGKSYLYGKERNWQCLFNGQYGWMLNENLVLGPNVGFSWNIQKERVSGFRIVGKKDPDDPEKSEPDKEVISNMDIPNRIDSKERMIMLPVSIFMIIDPIPQYMFHPVAQFSIGYNQAIISNVFFDNSSISEEEEEKRKVAKEYDGYYNGVYVKFGFDCMIDLGKQISIFAGPQWQISTMERKGNNKHYEYKFNAFGLRIGVSALL